MKHHYLKIVAFLFISFSCLTFGTVLPMAQTSGLETGIDFEIQLDEKEAADVLTNSNAALANICIGEKWWIRFWVNGACWGIGQTFEFPVVFTEQGIVGVNWTKEATPLDTITVPVKIESDCNGESEVFYATGLTTGYTVMEACAPGVGCLNDPEIYDFSVIALNSLELLEADAIVEENPDWAGGGKQIFPGKQSPDDTANRSKVQVKVATTLSDAIVYFKSFDMDDFASSLPEDLNGPGLAGNDNRGSPRNGTLSASSVQTDSNGYAIVDFEVTKHPGDNFMVAASCSEEYLNGVTVQGYELIDADGETLPTGKAFVTPLLTVWRRFHIELDSMSPVKGNEIKGIVNCKQSKNNNCDKTDKAGRTVLNVEQLFANGVSISSLNDGGRNGRFENGHITLLSGPIGGQEFDVATNSRSKVTLTTKISPVKYDTVFYLVDDDNYNGDLFYGDEDEAITADPNTSIVFSRMKDSNEVLENVFAPAFIRPTYDEAGVPPQSDHDGGLHAPPSPLTIEFDLNVSDREAPNKISSGIDSQGNDDYWVVYIQLGYQGSERFDKDPQTEHGLFPGATSVGDPRKDLTNIVTKASDVPIGGDGTLLYLEDLLNEAAIEERSTTAPHEVGHQFGLRGDRSGYGIMSDLMTNELPVFMPEHLNILRWRVRSPGQ